MAVDITLLPSTNLGNISTNFQRVATALEDVVGRSGDLPNQMNADLDLNGNQILNGFFGDTSVEDILEAADRAEAAAALAEGYANDVVSEGVEQVYSTVVSLPSLTVPAGINSIKVHGYYASSDGGGSNLTDINNGTTPIVISGGPTSRAWYINSETLRLRMFGARGNYNPDTRTGANDTAQIQAAFAASIVLEKELKTGKGTFYHLGELSIPSGMRLQGKRRATSRFYLELGSKQAGGRISAKNVYIADIGHIVYNTVVLGGGDGEFASGWSLAEAYFVDGEQFDTKCIEIRRCGAYAAPGTPHLPAHGIAGTGRFQRTVIDDFECIGFGGAAVQFHWGANGAGFDIPPIVTTYHPNTSLITNVYAEGCGRVLTLSSCYSVKASRLFGVNTKRFAEVIPGDEGLHYAEGQDLLLGGGLIHISDFHCTGLVNIPTQAALRVLSVGTSRVDFDPISGLGQRNLIFWRNVVVERGTLEGADDVERAIDLTGTWGNVTYRDIDVRGVARLGVGVRAGDNRGNIVLDNIQIASQTAIAYDRSRGVKFKNIHAEVVDRTGMASNITAVTTSGATHVSSLALALSVNDTIITLASPFGSTAILRPGDSLKVGTKQVIVAGDLEVRATDTIIPIKPSTFAEVIGATVTYEQFSEPMITGSTFIGYDFGMVLSATSENIDIQDNEFIDISRVAITSTSKSGRIKGNKFIRGGQIRITEPTYATRNITLSAGSENLFIKENEFGVDADYIDICLSGSVDTGNLRIIDNNFDKTITSHISLATQNATRLGNSQYNEIRGNYRKDGGELTGPSSWYEVLQNGIVRYHSTVAPTTGYHRAGSEWVDTTPSIGGPIGGMCTVSGNPGTWVNKANL